MKARNRKMPDRIFEIFYEKLPDSLEQVMPCYDRCKLVTFLIPYYMVKLNEQQSGLYEEFDYIASDGVALLWIQKMFGKSKSLRLSFDMTSLAAPVFNDIIDHHKNLYVLGSKPDIIDTAVGRIRDRFRDLKICGYHHGYIKGHEDEIISDILESGANIVIIGMGAPLQDEMAVRLKKSGFVGTVYTCGGFLHQIVDRIEYYPKWVDKNNLRAFYRWGHEKGTLKKFLPHLYGIVKYAIWMNGRHC